ncbi:uncharacterized protein LOC126890306 [Diabrotica virgifera virgifera]|uniref:Uncharacterized protein n=1 Tax=Diabrotica virgifera virgifera TaxID=50390 RepID=A0ABM5KY49_DIAVI|nr:uncharacterized protein LOC126890306 [Diabrotica virgifera virgifera]
MEKINAAKVNWDKEGDLEATARPFPASSCEGYSNCTPFELFEKIFDDELIELLNNTLKIYSYCSVPAAAVTFLIWEVTMVISMHTDNYDITDAVYHSLWYMTDIKTRKDIIFILMSSNITLQLEALPLGQMNFALLLMIMKGAFSYMALLQNSS